MKDEGRYIGWLCILLVVTSSLLPYGSGIPISGYKIRARSTVLAFLFITLDVRVHMHLTAGISSRCRINLCQCHSRGERGRQKRSGARADIGIHVEKRAPNLIGSKEYAACLVADHPCDRRSSTNSTIPPFLLHYPPLKLRPDFSHVDFTNSLWIHFPRSSSTQSSITSQVPVSAPAPSLPDDGAIEASNAPSSAL